MNPKKSIALLAGVAVAPIAALSLAACGDNNSSSSSPSPPQTANGQAATIGVANTRLGNVLVDSKGRTAYLFQLDTGTTSECSGSCAVQWPPVTDNGTPTVGSGADAALVGTTMRSDGSQQVTYNGHPLYEYIGDQKAGDTSGEGINAFGALWYAVDSTGNQVTGSASTAGGAGGY
jgi:predicted lipoprotein with Yx(FWY)xxD motif